MIGHQGQYVLEELVVSDDLLDEVGIVDVTPESVHEGLERIAAELLAYVDP